MAVIDPRVGNPFLPVPLTAPLGGSSRRTLVVGKRVHLMGLIMALPFIYLWAAYGKMEFRAPAPSRPAATLSVRGRILAGDGTVLASSVNRPDATIWDTARRTYPQGALAAQLVGFTNTDGGLEGIEHFQEAKLAAGKDVVLTIDPAFQASAEAGLAEIIKSEQADAGSVVAIEAGTGRVLAVANYPTFSPGHFQDGTPEAYGNRAFMFQYEPGSTVKALVAAALINDGDATPTTTLNAPMWRSVGGWRINDSVAHPSTLDLTHVLRYSSNVGISTLAERLGQAKLHAYYQAFGFGQPSPISGMASAPGLLHPWQDWSEVGFANASFGQGFSVTTLQLATAFSVLTNNGLYIPPRLVEGAPVEAPHRVVQAASAATTRAMLKTVIEEALPTAAGIPGYCLGGKTGTAQVAVNGGYSDTIYSALFAGFFPCDHPRVTMVVEVFNGRKSHHGSQVAAPAFRNIAEEVLAHWAVPPQPVAAEVR